MLMVVVILFLSARLIRNRNGIFRIVTDKIEEIGFEYPSVARGG